MQSLFQMYEHDSSTWAVIQWSGFLTINPGEKTVSLSEIEMKSRLFLRKIKDMVIKESLNDQCHHSI